METKHTPGPWTFTESVARGEHRFYICAGAAPPGAKLPALADTKPNARLIAAAPDMLNALLWVVQHHADFEHMTDDAANAIHAARAAIAKATGEQS
jgi:hypothetical protein